MVKIQQELYNAMKKKDFKPIFDSLESSRNQQGISNEYLIVYRSNH